MPSFQQGFARQRGESEYPELWNGLAGLWMPSLGHQGLTTFIDWSGRNNNSNHSSTLSNTNWLFSQFGSYIDYGSSGIYSNMGDVLDVDSASFSIFVQTKFPTQTVATNLFPGIICKTQNDSGLGFGLLVYTGAPNDNMVYFHCHDGVNSAMALSLVRLDDGISHFCVGVCDRTSQTASLFVDGKFNSSASTAGVGSLANTGDLLLGNRQSTTGKLSPFYGAIVSAGIYQRALTPSEVIALSLGASPLTLKRRTYGKTTAGWGKLLSNSRNRLVVVQ